MEPMKSYNVIYQHSHFIDKVTGKRLILQQGFEYVIIDGANSMLEVDEKLVVATTKNSEEKKQWVSNQFGKGNYIKIADAGEQLSFRFGNSKVARGDESQQYEFQCSLNEDLYLHLLKGRNGTNPNHWRLVECICELKECLQGNLKYTELIKAESLNKLFNQTVQFFFPNQRSGSTNVFTTFYFYKDGMRPTFLTPANFNKESLEDRRIKTVRSLTN